MPFPLSWVDHLFAKLQARYGLAFSGRYEGVNIDVVRADWAEVLDGFEGNHDAIAYALKNLPTDFAPNALQFREIARRAPAPEVAKLPPPPAAPQPERVVAELKRLATGKPAGVSEAKQVLDRLRELERINGRLSPAQKAQVEAIERMHSRATGGDAQ